MHWFYRIVFIFDVAINLISDNMKNSIYTFFFGAFFMSMTSNAQVNTMNLPGHEPSITNDQVRAFGEASFESKSKVVVLDFEGIGNLDEITQFYNGGASSAGFSGKNYGISFGKSALALVDAQHGGTGNFNTRPMPNTVMFFLNGSTAVINVHQGFTGQFAFDYTSSVLGTVAFYTEPDGGGTLISTEQFQPLATGSKGIENGYFDNWKNYSASFSGTAKSVVITCAADQCAFDNILIGDETYKNSLPGGGPVVTGSKTGDTGGAFQAASTGSYYFPGTKGKLFVAGYSGLDISAGTRKSKYNGEIDDGSKYSLFNIYFDPKAGYFIIDNLVAGLFIDLNYYSSKSKDEFGYSNKGTTLEIGPFARYYFPICDKLVPYGEAQIGVGVDNSSSRSSSSSEWYKSKSSVFAYQLGGGATYFFNSNVGADAFIGFSHYSNKYKDSESGERSPGSKYIYNELVLQLGIVIVLGY